MTLIERIEGAEGPSRELDAEIARSLGRPWDYAADWGPRGRDKPVAYAYTGSLDAAMSLVPEGMRWCVDTCNGNPRSFVEPRHPYEGQPFWGNAATPALALCAAALRAIGDTHDDA